MTEQAPAPVDERPAAAHGAAGWAVLAWLVVTGGRFAWAAVMGFGATAIPWWSKIATAAVALLALAAVVPLIRFRRSGWEMAMWVLVTALVMDVARIVMGTPNWIPAALAAGASAFSLGWAWRARAAFTGHDDDEWEDAVVEDRPAAASAVHPDHAPAEAAHLAADPVADALGAIHRRIVEAGSACAVPRETLMADAVRNGLRPEALRREGLALYRTFLDHFLADGPLTAEQDRELFCLESKLGLDAIAAARLRAEREAAASASAARPVVPVDEPPPVQADDPFRDESIELAADLAPTAKQTPGPAGVAASAPLADYEQHELDALLQWAGVDLPWDREPRHALDALRALHRISTEPLPEVDAATALGEGERCFAVRTVDLYRMTPGAQPDPGAGAADGVDAGAFVDGSLERDCDLSRYQRAGACRFAVTDRRLLLVAPSGEQSPLPLERIRAVHPHHNGLEVHPARGNPVFLAFSDGVADAAMRIARLLRDARGAGPA